jgi:hypothetical protein
MSGVRGVQEDCGRWEQNKPLHVTVSQQFANLAQRERSHDLVTNISQQRVAHGQAGTAVIAKKYMCMSR